MPRNAAVYTVAIAVLMLSGCESDTSTSTGAVSIDGDTPIETGTSLAGTEVFSDIARESGLVFDHFIGASGEFYLPEIMGPGVALIDFDNDGDLDVFITQGTMLDRDISRDSATFPPVAGHAPGDRLFRNDLQAGGPPRFVDVSIDAGIDSDAYSMGVATGDIDNDGDTDLYVTRYGSNVLYRNNGDGTFTDLTAQSGTDDERWSTSAAFIDYDRDGDLDLFLANYLNFTLANHRHCLKPTGERDYCSPDSYKPVRDRLFRNDGQGVFDDVSESSGISSVVGPGLGVTAADFNGDNWPDLYVANDMSANALWLNQQDGTFINTGLASGSAYNQDGRVEASMGVTAGDLDGDGDDDLFMTHLNKQSNTLYVNDGRGRFSDRTNTYGLGLPSVAATGFGTAWFDLDNNGFLDLFTANGAVMIEQLQVVTSDFPYAQRNQLFVHGARYSDISGTAGDAMAFEEVSRGAAFGDIDNDGDTDIVVGNCNGPVRLLLNLIGQSNPWLSISLRGRTSNRDGTGSRVALIFKDQAPLWRRAHTDGSYLSASDPRVLFGLGEFVAPEAIIVEWSGGSREQFAVPELRTNATLVEGTGSPVVVPAD
jgi:hypothetical protein